MHSEYRMQVRAGNGATFRSGWNSYNRTVREFNTITYSVFSFYLDKMCQNIIAMLGCRSVAKIGAGLWWDSKFEKLQNFYLIQLEPIFQGSVSFKCCWAKTHLKLKTCFLGQNWVEPSGFLVGTLYCLEGHKRWLPIILGKLGLMFCSESCPWFTRLQNNASSLAVGGFHILVLTLPWVFFSGFQNWILNHSARDILLVGYFPNCVAAPPSDSFARHKLTGRTWLRRPQVGRGRPTPTHRRCISKILWWPNMTLPWIRTVEKQTNILVIKEAGGSRSTPTHCLHPQSTILWHDLSRCV